MAAIVLKSLSDALRDGDPIQSVIRATAVNQDGQTPSVTMPSQSAQVRIINKAYAKAGLDPRETCYIEAHGKIYSSLLVTKFQDADFEQALERRLETRLKQVLFSRPSAAIEHQIIHCTSVVSKPILAIQRLLQA